MANDNICVFCGQKPGTFRSTTVNCGGVFETACKACEKEVASLKEVEVCRRALARGLAKNPERIYQRIDLLTQAEKFRPRCPYCGTKLIFTKEQRLDNSPILRDSIFNGSFDLLPAICTNCGKYEFFHPAIARKNKYLVHLIYEDSNK